MSVVAFKKSPGAGRTMAACRNGFIVFVNGFSPALRSDGIRSMPG